MNRSCRSAGSLPRASFSNGAALTNCDALAYPLTDSVRRNRGHGGECRASLVERLLELRGGVGVRHDASASLHVGQTIFDDHCADRDGHLHVAVETEEPSRAGVGATLIALELGDDLHC